MEILGRGHKGIVIVDTATSIKKFYESELEAEEEQISLEFLGNLQDQGFNIGCTIPRLLEVIGEGAWEVEGKTYIRCNRMERIPGISARQAIAHFNQPQLETLGKNLGTIAFALHSLSKAYIELWKRIDTSQDKLLEHVLDDKAAQVLREEPDKGVTARVKDAAQYLEDQRESLAPDNVLSHLDLSLSNILVSDTSHVNGLVDWGSFGLTNPSLSLYQLAARPVWPYVKQQYEQEGGSVREDIVYGAASIHLAWAPIICNQLGLPIEPHETRDHFEAMYTRFEENTVS